MRIDAGKEISKDAAVAAVSCELDGISASKEEQRTALEVFLGAACFHFPPIWLWHEFS